MTRYFVVKVHIFDIEDFHAVDSIKYGMEKYMALFMREYEGVCWEDVKVKEVEISEYEKED